MGLSEGDGEGLAMPKDGAMENEGQPNICCTCLFEMNVLEISNCTCSRFAEGTAKSA